MHHLNQNPWTSSKTQNSKLAASSIHSPSTHSILFFQLIRASVRLVILAWQRWLPPKTSLWACEPWIPGCYPHCRRKWCDGGGGGLEKKAGWESWKQSHQCDGLSGRRPKRGQKEGGEEEQKERKGGGDGGLPSRLLSALWRGSWGCQICGASRCWLAACVCEYPSVYLSVPMCVHLSTTLYMCVLGEVHN